MLPVLLPFATERLLLRPLQADDAQGMFELDSDPAVHHYLGGVGGVMVTSLADSQDTIRYIQSQYATHGIGRWAVLLRSTGEFMGWAGFKLVAGPINGQHDFYDLGYRFLPRYWRQGYGYEAASAWLARGFGVLALPRVCAYADVRNVASCCILKKIGLRPGNTFVEQGVACRWFEASTTLPSLISRAPTHSLASTLGK